MSAEISAEEQKQIKNILKRWHNANSFGVAIFRCLPQITISSLLMGVIMSFFAPKYIGIITPFFTTPMLGYLFYRNALQRRNFLQQMTEEEKLLLEKTAQEQNDRIHKEIREVLQAYAQIQLSQELLRPSHPTENSNTLLRAAASTNDTAQEQLLRPAQNDEIQCEPNRNLS